jgi:hypothetical protein
MRKLGDPTPNDICERLYLGKMKNTVVTHKTPVVKFERLPVDEVQKNQELQVGKMVFLLGVLIPMKYIFLAPLASRAQSAIWPALKRFILLPRSRGINIDIVRTDPEGGVVSSEAELAELGCELNPGGSKEAVPVVELTIKGKEHRQYAPLHPTLLSYRSAVHIPSVAAEYISAIHIVERLHVEPSR